MNTQSTQSLTAPAWLASLSSVHRAGPHPHPDTVAGRRQIRKARRYSPRQRNPCRHVMSTTGHGTFGVAPIPLTMFDRLLVAPGQSTNPIFCRVMSMTLDICQSVYPISHTLHTTSYALTLRRPQFHVCKLGQYRPVDHGRYDLDQYMKKSLF